MTGCKGLYAWSTGRFGSRLMQQLALDCDLGPLLRMSSKFARKVLFNEETLSGEVMGFVSMSFRVNRIIDGGPRLQLPYVITDPTKRKGSYSEDKKGCILVRCIIPLDKAGLVMRVWPKGTDGEDKLVYVQPGTVLFLPSTVATSDCLRFSPLGQRRVELAFAYVRNGKKLPASCQVRDSYYYMDEKQGTRFEKATRYSASVYDECDAEHMNVHITEFNEMFRNLN